MSEGSAGGQDSRRGKEAVSPDGRDAAGSDTYDLYRRGMDLLSRGSAAAAAQLLERAAAAEPHSRSVLEALARAQFDAGRYAAAAGNFRRIVEASPSDDYAQFGLGLALARTGDPGAAAEHLALAAAMQPDRRHYADALRSVRATLRARKQAAAETPDNPERKPRGI
jgi:Flp pilus assembly protein TadD